MLLCMTQKLKYHRNLIGKNPFVSSHNGGVFYFSDKSFPHEIVRLLPRKEAAIGDAM